MLQHCSQPATHTHIHTNTFLPVCHHRVSNSLRFASLTSPSQSLCTAAGRGSRHTLTHTLCSAPIFFGREETRSEQNLDSLAFFIFSNGELLQKEGKRFRGFLFFLPHAESCFEEIPSIVISGGICTTRLASPKNETSKKWEERRGSLDVYLVDFAVFHGSLFFWMSEKVGAMSKGSP